MLTICYFTWAKCVMSRLPLQENLLIDEDQNLKLIDFGLCAKPKVQIHIPCTSVNL